MTTFEVEIPPVYIRARRIQVGNRVINLNQPWNVVSISDSAHSDNFVIKLRDKDWNVYSKIIPRDEKLVLVPNWPLDLVLMLTDDVLLAEAYDMMRVLTDSDFEVIGLCFYATLDEMQYAKAMNTGFFASAEENNAFWLDSR